MLFHDLRNLGTKHIKSKVAGMASQISYDSHLLKASPVEDAFRQNGIQLMVASYAVAPALLRRGAASHLPVILAGIARLLESQPDVFHSKLPSPYTWSMLGF
jgi:hypothetical protein